ncbi:unnamed protein product [Owenia fusiformis]|uniref:Uncharacterized protein n=1 Tax=Owenia fusiformis TaxID=6347 RepID=A0A8J1XJA2_OWEFU|nr:unnamed protein product [Owenia fusiformis]
MDGGIDMAYSKHFGWQLQRRLQEVIRKEKYGELLVGDAVIIPTFEHGIDSEEVQELQKRDDWAKCNEGQPIKFMISAPTMRVPLDVSKTVNAYSTFRAVIIAVSQHNETAESTDQIRSVLCPGLGTAIGTMPHQRCAHQMRKALEMYVLGRDEHIRNPKDLGTVWKEHDDMTEFGHADIPPPPKEGKVQKWSLFGLF